LFLEEVFLCSGRFLYISPGELETFERRCQSAHSISSGPVKVIRVATHLKVLAVMPPYEVSRFAGYIWILTAPTSGGF